MYRHNPHNHHKHIYLANFAFTLDPCLDQLWFRFHYQHNLVHFL